MNLQTAFDAESAEKKERTCREANPQGQSFPGKLALTQWVNVDFPSAISAALRALR